MSEKKDLAKIEENQKEFAEKFKKEYESKTNIEEIMNYLGLNSQNPNMGTKNKRVLMEKALILLKQYNNLENDVVIGRLSLRLNLTVRTVRENYVEPLICEGIIVSVGSKLFFKGIPEEGINNNE